MTPPLFLYVSSAGIAGVCKSENGVFSTFWGVVFWSFFDHFLIVFLEIIFCEKFFILQSDHVSVEVSLR